LLEAQEGGGFRTGGLHDHVGRAGEVEVCEPAHASSGWDGTAAPDFCRRASRSPVRPDLSSVDLATRPTIVRYTVAIAIKLNDKITVMEDSAKISGVMDTVILFHT